ncbi:glycosyltransferase family 2 protein [Oleidesulfovibrio sp.]|uniref:glycosyltransferase family 2 protein n=1 Tax=Oleidesulfovibrio sp. TaxID=2909707 RepID=UPI003A8A5639
MASQPLVTVYITNYNYGAYLRQAVDSVFTQTFTDYELIIIDDGSTDGSREIVLEYEGREGVTVLLQQNSGLNRTSNTALSMARGRYIMRLDADDYLAPQALAVMVEVLERNPSVGLVFPDYYYVNESGAILGREIRNDFNGGVSLPDMPAHGACTLIRRSHLLSVGGYSEEFRCQDGYDLWLRFIEKHEVRNVNEPLFYYRQHGGSLSGNRKMIVETRARIKAAHAQRSNRPECPTLAFIPVRGKSVDSGCLALESLDGKTLLDWTIDAALEAQQLCGVAVTTPDADVIAHVRSRYGDAVHVLERPKQMARSNTTLHDTMMHVLQNMPEHAKTACACMMLSVETPFRSSLYIDKAINTARIFDVDTVIAVSPENDLFFRHDGTGLHLVGNDMKYGGKRFEREYLFRAVPGLHLLTRSWYESNPNWLGDRVGHIVLAEDALHLVRTMRDLAVAQTLLSWERN